MKISVDCPSYKRPKVKTLDYLPFCKIWVSEEEYEAYREANPGAEIAKLGVPQGNISRVRNHILDREFADGADVVCIVDDDMDGIYRYEADGEFGYEKIKVEADEFLTFVEKYSVMAQDIGAYLWGVNVNSDPKAYRHMAPFSTTSIILGPFSCHLKGTKIRYDVRIPLKEDYDLAIQHLNRYRVIFRVNKFHYECKQSENAGGCAVYRNYETEKAQFDLLVRKWGPDIVRTDKGSKKSKMDYNPIIKIPIKGI